MRQLRSWVMNHEVLAFFLLTFLISWGTWIPLAGVYFNRNAYLAGVPMSWGVFGPALAGILITRLIHPRAKGASRREGVLAFTLAWVLTALVWIVFISKQVGVPRTQETMLVSSVMGALIALAPAYVVSSAYGRNPKVRTFLHSLIKPRGAWIYYLIAILLTPVLFWVGSVLSDLAGLITYWRPSNLNSIGGIGILGLAFLYQFCFGNVLGEEVGWRGFALSKLQARVSPLVASLIITPVWFAWHLPLKLANPDVIPMLYYGLTFIPSTILLTWIYNRSQGSILAVGIAHVATNLAGKYLFPITVGSLIVQMLVALVVIFTDRMWIRTSQDLLSYASNSTGDRSPAVI